MNVAASSRGIFSRTERPYSLRPYSTPKLNTLARRRISGVPSASDTPTTCEGGADGDVLEVRVARGEAAGGRARLIELRVQPVRLRVDQRWQRVQVGGLQLRQLAVGVDQLDHVVQAAEPLQRLRVRGVGAGLQAARLRQVQLFEQDVAEPLGGAGGELVADRLVYLVFDAVDLPRQRPRKLPQRADIDGDAVQLHG